MHLDNLLCQIQANRCNLVHDFPSHSIDGRTSILALRCRLEQGKSFPFAQPGRLAGGAYAPSARRRLAWFVGRQNSETRASDPGDASMMRMGRSLRAAPYVPQDTARRRLCGRLDHRGSMRKNQRRAFLVASSALLFAPLAASAQNAPNARRIAILEQGDREARGYLWRIFDARMRELGYIEGQNLFVDRRWAN